MFQLYIWVIERWRDSSKAVSGLFLFCVFVIWLLSCFSVGCPCLLLPFFCLFGVSDYSVRDFTFTPIFFIEFYTPSPLKIFFSLYFYGSLISFPKRVPHSTSVTVIWETARGNGIIELYDMAKGRLNKVSEVSGMEVEPHTSLILGFVLFHKFSNWWDVVMQKRLAWALFVLLSANRVDWGFFKNYLVYPPPPPRRRKWHHSDAAPLPVPRHSATDICPSATFRARYNACGGGGKTKEISMRDIGVKVLITSKIGKLMKHESPKSTY